MVSKENLSDVPIESGKKYCGVRVDERIIHLDVMTLFWYNGNGEFVKFHGDSETLRNILRRHQSTLAVSVKEECGELYTTDAIIFRHVYIGNAN